MALFYSHVLCFWTPRNFSNSLCRLQLAPGVLCVCFYLIRFDYWKALLSCEKHKSKHIRPSLVTNISSKKQSTDLSILSKQEKITFETSHILTTDQEIDTETLVTKKDLEALQISSAMASPTDLANTEDSSIVHKINDLVYQNDQNANGIESQKGEFKKQTSTKPLKVRVNRFSTRKYNKHHVEEVKFKLISTLKTAVAAMKMVQLQSIKTKFNASYSREL